MSARLLILLQVKDLRTSLGATLSGRDLQYCNDACLRRYLEARNWNVDKSKKMLEESLKWRSKFKPEEIRWVRKETKLYAVFIFFLTCNMLLNTPTHPYCVSRTPINGITHKFWRCLDDHLVSCSVQLIQWRRVEVPRRAYSKFLCFF